VCWKGADWREYQRLIGEAWPLDLDMPASDSNRDDGVCTKPRVATRVASLGSLVRSIGFMSAATRLGAFLDSWRGQATSPSWCHRRPGRRSSTRPPEHLCARVFELVLLCQGRRLCTSSLSQFFCSALMDVERRSHALEKEEPWRRQANTFRGYQTVRTTTQWKFRASLGGVDDQQDGMVQ
jgi:hypothetical protein